MFVRAWLVWSLCCSHCTAQYWSAETYWNSRYSGKLNYVDYTPLESTNGMWSDEYDMRGHYLFSNNYYDTSSSSWACCDSEGKCTTCYGGTCDGCSCTPDRVNLTNCHGSKIVLKKMAFKELTPATFTSTAITSITILDCSSFSRIANDTFDKLTSLTHLVIQFTAIDRFPDISNTALQILNLAENKIVIDTLTYTDQVLPSTLTHVALMNNAIYWLPPEMFSNSNVRFLSLSYNKFIFFPTEALMNMPNLLYLGLDGNQLKAISRANMLALSTSPLQHLNISNNNIFFIEQHVLSSVPELKILELHKNKLANIPAYTFDNIAKLFHLELNHNDLKIVGTEAFTNLPELITLILHSQEPGMELIQYDAFRNIGSKLESLWVSDNSLPVFPHQVLAAGNYPLLTVIYADHNLIVDVTDLGKESYMRQKESFVPLATTKNVQTLYLGNNHIREVQEEDFCELSHLHDLFLEGNQLTEDTIHPESFRCLRELSMLTLDYNQCQYVPVAVTTAERVPSLTSLSMTSNHLTFLLKGTFSNVTTLTSLSLSSNAIVTIEDGTFPASLVTLGLQSNQFRFQHEHPFTNLRHLSALYLSNNQITVIPDTAFHNLTSLNNLNLASNHIRRILKIYLKDCPLSGSLFLQMNEIAYMEDGTIDHITSITYLDLSSNQLTELPNGGDFCDITVHLSLRLNNNRVTFLPTGVFNNTRCDSLDLSSNKIAIIESDAFRDVTVSKSLSLGSNQLRTLHAYSFHGLHIGDSLVLNGMHLSTIPSLAFVDVRVGDSVKFNGNLQLGSNQIEVIESEAFQDVSVLYDFDLTSNPLQTLHTLSFHHVSCNRLLMSDMALSTLPSQAFRDVSVTQSFELDNNLIKSIEAEAFSSVSTKYLYLQDNQLEKFEGKLFGGTSSVSETLDLSDNKLTCLPSDLLDGASITKVTLDHNLLDAYPRLSIPDFSKISLTHNLLIDLPVGTFTLDQGLTELDLRYNHLIILPAGLLQPLTSLQILRWNNNMLLSVEQGALDNLPSLKEIYLQENNLTFFPSLSNVPALSTVDLSNNKIHVLGYDAFSGIGSSAYECEVQLAGNPLDCDCYLYDTLSAVNTMSGLCSTPDTAAGLSFRYPDKLKPTYYLNVNLDMFICSAAGVTASSPGSSQVKVEWDAPMYLYPSNGTDVSSGPISRDPGMSGAWTYTVTCRSDMASTLMTVVRDDSGGINETSLTHTFTETDGVEAAIEYRCNVTLSINNFTRTSGHSPPALVTTPTLNVNVNITVETGDNQLDISYYDFDKTHKDFAYDSSTNISKPMYVASPYGAWLAISYTPSCDSFSDWFRSVPIYNHVVQSTLVLKYIAAEQVNRFWNDSFFPVDMLGYEDRDCDGKLHNFGFTSAVRAGFKFEGSGRISIGGGDEMWLYVNKVLLLEVLTTSSSATPPCKRVDISAASQSGGAYVVPQGGTVINGECVVTTSLDGEKVLLELEVGDTYHLSVFHAERKLCRSQLFIETKDLVFYQDPLTEDPPMDHFVSVSEDLHIGGLVAEIPLTDVFSTGPNFDVSITKGNEARHVTIIDNSSVAAPPNVTLNYTSLPDVNIAFIECDPTSPKQELNVTGTEDFAISTSVALMTLALTLDYEVAKRYVIILQVVDSAATPPATGQVVIRLTVVDENDNCPVLNTSYQFEPLPALSKQPNIVFSATDTDVGVNAEFMYMVSQPHVDPPLTRYNESDDLYRVVYNETSDFVFTLVVIDRGSPPRGSMATIRVTLSNTCLLSVLYEALDMTAVLDRDTGTFSLQLPRYWVYDYECLGETGMQKGFVLGSWITASTHQVLSPPDRARLNLTYDATGLLSGGWVAAVTDGNQWLQVDMTTPYKFRKLMIQGREDEDMWVTEFTITHSNDGSVFELYKNINGTSLMLGNSDRNGIVTVDLVSPILARFIRVNPQAWIGGISLRLEFMGCSQAKQKHYDTTCQRCPASWYCTGDGSRLPCARCEGATCGQNATEHSFGAALECTTCPEGWLCNDGYATPCPLHKYAQCSTDSCPSTCTPCQPGYACRGGVRYECPSGTYSDGLQDYCEMCQPGTYQNAPGQTGCVNCSHGYISSKMKDRCGACPEGTWSDGSGEACVTCTGVSDCPCLTDPYPCYQEARCFNYKDGGTPAYVCDVCPPGYHGDGVTCTDIDECQEYNPCWNSSCVNTIPGYQCHGCPPGYGGSFEDAISINSTRRIYVFCGQTYSTIQLQTCADIDECALNNGGCDVNAQCSNTVGSFSCDACNEGYLGDAFYGCYSDNFCTNDRHDCDKNAECIYTEPGLFLCECRDGYAGDGKGCGTDPDLDGLPSKNVHCSQLACVWDNCPDRPNSGQEDNDHDYIGDFCDLDDDNDSIYDDVDNCQFTPNYHQTDTDGDGVGDTCDNCPNLTNSDQVDTDGDGLGDACDNDDDNDGTDDGADNCSLVFNNGTDIDGDGLGDVCDNCPTVANADQTDTDQNGVGDACDILVGTNKDRDGDSIHDLFDNCVDLPNPDQSNIDGDGMGDLCDSDIDGDGVDNAVDNCPYVSNPGQEDTNGDKIGDVCEDDTDGDGVVDNDDHCPKNPNIQGTDFHNYTVVDLLPGVNQSEWLLFDNGAEIRQVADIDRPVMLIGPAAYGALNFSGTWFVDSDQGNDYIGFIFGYQTNKKFYAVLWRHENHNYDANYQAGIKGVQIKVVNSETGPGTNLARALWHSADTTNQATLLWHEPSMLGWQHKMAYRWHLSWRPTRGLIRLQVFDSNQTLMDSGDLYDTSITGGRLGVFVFNQTKVTWSNLVAQCIERENEALSFDGSQDYVKMTDVETLQVKRSFTVGVWVQLSGAGLAGKQPIVCLLSSQLCLYVNDSRIGGQVGQHSVEGSTVLSVDTWYHLAMRYEAETHTLDLFINGASSGAEATHSSVPPLVWSNTTSADNSTTFYLGRDESNFFSGVMDEVRVYRIALLDADINRHLEMGGLVWPVYMKYVTAHYTMDNYKYNRSGHLTDTGMLGLTGELHGHPQFVKSTHDFARFTNTYPANK